jgi:hypothetical protein
MQLLAALPVGGSGGSGAVVSIIVAVVVMVGFLVYRGKRR